MANLANAGDLADNLMDKYIDIRIPTQEVYESIIDEDLKELIRLLKIVEEYGPSGDDRCRCCGYAHNEAILEHNRRMKILRRLIEIKNDREKP